MKELLSKIRSCAICADKLPLGAKPIVSGHERSRIVILSQAPGLAAHESGMAWDDKSGNNLRNWLDVSKDEFYNEDFFAVLPTGFCYPGRGKSGDLPPMTICAPTWHALFLKSLQNVELILLIGNYAQKSYLGKRAFPTLTETVRNFHVYLPQYFVLPHPSPRNNIWMKKNEWFSREVLPTLKKEVRGIIKAL